MAVKVVLKSSGVRDLLRSAEVQADLRDRAARIAAAAGDGNEIDSQVGPTRARAAVITRSTKAKLRESTSRSLTRAVDAGR